MIILFQACTCFLVKMWKSLKELQISDRLASSVLPFNSINFNVFFRLLASQYLELASQQRKASSKCWRRRKLCCLLQTLTLLPLILLLFQLLQKGRHLFPTTHPGQSGSTCARNQSSMSMAALARQGNWTNLYFSLLPSQVS